MSGVVYDADGNIVARFDPRAYASSTTSPDASYMVRTDYDADGRASAQYVPRYSSSVTDPTTNTTQTTQCPTTAPTPVTGVPAYPTGVGSCVTKAQYDAAGNTVKVILPTSNGTDNRYVAYSYTDDRLVSTVDSPDPATANARTQSTAVYDADAKPVTIIDPLGHSNSTTYTADELVAVSTDALNHSTSYSYDANGNQTLVTDPMGIKTQTDYYADNLRKDVIGAAQDTSGTYKHTTAYAYDSVGNVTTVYSPSAWLVHTGLAADANNQLGTPSQTTYTYDNLVNYTVDPVVAKTGQALQQRRTDYGYDLGGRKTSQHTYLVDANLNAISGGDAGTQSFSYYQDDRQSVQTGRDGETITTLYDPAGNRTSVQDSTGGGSTISATYYLDSRPRTVDDGSKTSQYAYDGSGLALTRAEANDGLLTSPSISTTYSYNDAGLAASMQSTVVGNAPTSFTYDHAGRMVGESDPNTTQQAWSYNNDNTLSTHTVTSATSTLASWGYGYNADKQQTQQTFSGTGALTTTTGLDTQQFAYAYDPAGRLSTFTTGTAPTQTTKSITFDHNGNRLAYGGDGYTYNADNSIATFTPSGGSAQSFTYYAFGGLHSDTCMNSAYDGFDRLTSETAAGACGTGASGNYTYDGLDRQRSHQESTSAVRPLHYDGLSTSVVAESPTAGDINYELAADGSRRGVAQAATIQYLADDGFGNITTVTGVGGTVACTARFDPFGNPRLAQGTTAASRNACNTGSTINTFFYRGGRQDQTTGDYQFGSRIYDPTKSAFLTPDSYRAGDAGKNVSVGTDPLTQNRYSYVNGDPVNLSDPTGHDPAGSYDVPSGVDPYLGDVAPNSPGLTPEGRAHARQSRAAYHWAASRGWTPQGSVTPVTRSAPNRLMDINPGDGAEYVPQTWNGTMVRLCTRPSSGVLNDMGSGCRLVDIRAGENAPNFMLVAYLCQKAGLSTCWFPSPGSWSYTATEIPGGGVSYHHDDRSLLIFGSEFTVTCINGRCDDSRSHVQANMVVLPGESSALGDLTTSEVAQIQGVVDSAGRPLNVVGSAARGTRRAIGSDLPVGKGPGTRSDIDYLVPPGSFPYFRGLQGDLPSIDPGGGIIVGQPNPWIGPWIRFEPGAEPYAVPGEPQ